MHIIIVSKSRDLVSPATVMTKATGEVMDYGVSYDPRSCVNEPDERCRYYYQPLDKIRNETT